MLKILINPMLLQKPESNFLNEIYNGKESKKITKQYLNSFSKERRQIRRAGYHLDIMAIVFTILCIGIILLAINK